MKAAEFRSARESTGLSMAEAARKCGVPYRTWQNYEGGQNPVPPYAKCLLHYLRTS